MRVSSYALQILTGRKNLAIIYELNYFDSSGRCDMLAVA